MKTGEWMEGLRREVRRGNGRREGRETVVGNKKRERLDILSRLRNGVCGFGEWLPPSTVGF